MKARMNWKIALRVSLILAVVSFGLSLEPNGRLMDLDYSGQRYPKPEATDIEREINNLVDTVNILIAVCILSTLAFFISLNRYRATRKQAVN